MGCGFSSAADKINAASDDGIEHLNLNQNNSAAGNNNTGMGGGNSKASKRKSNHGTVSGKYLNTKYYIYSIKIQKTKAAINFMPLRLHNQVHITGSSNLSNLPINFWIFQSVTLFSLS